MNTTNNMLPARTTMVIISILLVLGAFAAEKEEIVDGIRWTYLVAPSGAIITANSRWCDDKCHTEEIVKIPAKLGGHPVVRIRGDISPVVGYVPEIIIPEGIVSLGSIGLVGETSVRVSLPSTLKELRDYAFANCGLYSITLPKGLKTIGKRAFYWCRALEMSNIPDGVSYIGEYAFCGVKLKCCKIPSGITQISANAFSHTTIEVITFHPGVVEIGEEAFRGCDNLKSINWAAGLKRIGDEAFRKCYALESVELPCGVEFIGKDAFRDCEKLETVVIPNSVKHIAEGAFKGCKNLVSVTISEDYKYAVTDIFPGLDDYSIFIYTDSSKWVKSLGGEIATDAFAASEKSVASNMHNSKVPQNKINQVKAMKQITFRIKANRDDSGVDADRDIIIKCCKYGRFRVGEFMILEASDGSFLQACSNNRSGILDYIEARTPGNPGGGYRVESCTQEQIKDAFLRFYNQDESWKTFMLWREFRDNDEHKTASWIGWLNRHVGLLEGVSGSLIGLSLVFYCFPSFFQNFVNWFVDSPSAVGGVTKNLNDVKTAGHGIIVDIIESEAGGGLPTVDFAEFYSRLTNQMAGMTSSQIKTTLERNSGRTILLEGLVEDVSDAADTIAPFAESDTIQFAKIVIAGKNCKISTYAFGANRDNAVRLRKGERVRIEGKLYFVKEIFLYLDSGLFDANEALAESVAVEIKNLSTIMSN